MMLRRTGTRHFPVVSAAKSLPSWPKSRVCISQGLQFQLLKHPNWLRTQSRIQRKQLSPKERMRAGPVCQESTTSIDNIAEAGFQDIEKKPPAVSVIIPVYNEVATIGTLVEKVGSVMQERGEPYEVVCVDDGSTDGTTKLLKFLASTRDDMQVIIFRRNFGQTAAMAAGFDFAAGEIFVTMDGDLQNDAEDIPRLVEQLVWGNQPTGKAVETGVVREDGGFDLVCGWRRKRSDNVATRNFPSWVANGMIGALTGVKLHDCGCSLKAYRASLLSSIRLFGEMHRFIPALAAIEGAAISEIEVRHHPRTLGKSKYGLGRVFRVLMDLTTMVFFQRFRDKPMHLIGFLGGLCMLGSTVASVFTIWSLANTAQTWGYGVAIANARPWFVFSVHLLVLGFQLVCLGLLAEVCVRTYFESEPRPVYRIREVVASATR